MHNHRRHRSLQSPWRVLWFTVAVLVLFLAHCGWSPTDGDLAGKKGSGGGSEVVTIIHEPDGAPAPRARVVVVETDAVPDTAGQTGAFTTTTDSLGRYSLAALEPGTYNIFADKDGSLSLRSGVELPLSGGTLHDTLDSPGALHGIVRLRYHDSRRMLILVRGSQFWFTPDDSIGRTALGGLPGGTYAVRFLPQHPDYQVLDTTLTITAGVTDTLTDTIYLPYTGDQPARDLTAAYDTMLMMTTLAWQPPPDTQGVAGYNVYRRERTSSEQTGPLNRTPLSTTTFTDSTVLPAGSEAFYYVRTIDHEGAESASSARTGPVHIATAFTHIRTIGDTGVSAGIFDLPMGLVVVDELIYVVDQGKRCVTVVDSVGKVVSRFGEGELVEPVEIAQHEGTLFVCDWAKGTAVLREFSTAGIPRRAISCGEHRLIDVGLWGPDSFLVIDAEEMAVSLIDSTGARQGRTAVSLESPVKIALTSGSAYLADRNGCLVRECTKGLELTDTLFRAQRRFCGERHTQVGGVAAEDGLLCVAVAGCPSTIWLLDLEKRTVILRGHVPGSAGGFKATADIWLTPQILFCLSLDGAVHMLRLPQSPRQ